MNAINMEVASRRGRLLVHSRVSEKKEKKKVTNQSDLPRFTYPLSISASDLVQADNTTFTVFAVKVKADLDTIFHDYDITDKAVRHETCVTRFYAEVFCPPRSESKLWT
jgi:hypothetical protein